MQQNLSRLRGKKYAEFVSLCITKWINNSCWLKMGTKHVLSAATLLSFQRRVSLFNKIHGVTRIITARLNYFSPCYICERENTLCRLQWCEKVLNSVIVVLWRIALLALFWSWLKMLQLHILISEAISVTGSNCTKIFIITLFINN